MASTKDASEYLLLCALAYNGHCLQDGDATILAIGDTKAILGNVLGKQEIGLERRP